jgi:hypothetical protein
MNRPLPKQVGHPGERLLLRLLQKCVIVVRQAHHERKSQVKSQCIPFTLSCEPVEQSKDFRGVLQEPLLIEFSG